MAELRISWLLITLPCSLAFLLQMASIVNNFLNPTLSNTVSKTVNLNEMDFPFLIKICLKPDFNERAVKEAGYINSLAYVMGEQGNESSVSGCSEDGSEGCSIGWADQTGSLEFVNLVIFNI